MTTIYFLAGITALIIGLWAALKIQSARLDSAKAETVAAKVEVAQAQFETTAHIRTQQAVQAVEEQQKIETKIEVAKIAAGDRSALDRDD